MVKDHPSRPGAGPASEEAGARAGTFPDPRVRPGSRPGKVRQVARPCAGVAGLRRRLLRTPGVRTRRPGRSGWLGWSLSRLGAEGRWGALTVMAAPGGGGGRRQEGVRGAQAGLRGAGIPLPPPLSAARSRSSGPSLRPRGSGPVHPPIKLFFFFKLPGRTRARQWAAGKPGQTAAGPQANQWGRGTGPGAGPARRDGCWGRGGRDGWGRGEGGRGEGRAGRARPRARGAEGASSQQVTPRATARQCGVWPTSPRLPLPAPAAPRRPPGLLGAWAKPPTLTTQRPTPEPRLSPMKSTLILTTGLTEGALVPTLLMRK